ncbi:toxin co-regulated pilus biosynthesis Q family protein [Defluviimonas salinarum]|uniref:Toxin co-regulated pilus biosynthesis Q family protein n=1 Tax=Defluviimonas salinarum TaxID=2992147 RepID=A0ABT3J4F0_9RHOB|nr:toxin co-regulated pilus biosynthesis Q family protein [Defluviimonas salinarum]MCW3782569.1 toxin co-regulated pilus biosynthesis Q family protein [Defluviimonas salinarum]
MKTSSDMKLKSRIGLAALAAVALSGLAGTASADVGAISAAPAATTQDQWVVMAGTSLKSTLEGWTRVSGWTLIWDSPVDYRMRASATFSGGFEESASRLIDSIYNGNPELMATFHRGNRVLHIENQPLSSN